MNKDNKFFSLWFPRFLTNFLLNLHLTHEVLLSKKGGNDSLIWVDSFLVEDSSVSINIMMNIDIELELSYITAWCRHL